MELVPCVGCRRHVDVGGATCPFCDAAVVAPPPRVLRAVPSLTRAAIFYLGATVASACGPATTEVPREEQIAQPYGAPPNPPDDSPPVDDDAVDDEVEEDEDPPEAVEEGDVTETEAAAPEEAPPPRRRVRRAELPPPSNAPYGAPPIWDELV